MNALIVSLFGLVPGTNMGIPAFILGITGLLFTAAGIRRTLAGSVRAHPLILHAEGQQPGLLILLLLTFGFELGFGVVLLVNVNDTSALANIGDILIVSLIIGIARAWELVGEWDTNILSSLTLLVRTPSTSGEPDAPGAAGPAATESLDQPRRDQEYE